MTPNSSWVTTTSLLACLAISACGSSTSDSADTLTSTDNTLNSSISASDGTWAFPVGSPESGEGWFVTIELGESWTSTSGVSYRGHLAEDWFKSGATALGEPVYAAAAGKVVVVRQNCGNYVDVVVIEHNVGGERIYSLYGHLEGTDSYVAVDDEVQKRQQIGVIGDPTPWGFAPHLHFSILNRTAFVEGPHSNCTQPNGRYIATGYSGKSNDYDDALDYYDPSNDGIRDNRFYHPRRFIGSRLLPPPGDFADLRVSGISFSSAPTLGVRTTAIASLANVGRTSSGVFNVKWYLNGVQVGYGRHESLAPGEVSNGNVRFDWTPKQGTHRLRFEADVDAHVTESDDTNNAAEVTKTVSGDPNLADLRVSGISFSSAPTLGVRTTAIASLANVGQLDSEVFNVKWYLDSVQVGYGRHESLAPGQTSNGNVRFDWTPTAGAHRLRFEADVDAHVAESDETNNAIEGTINVQVVPLADLRVSGISFSSAPTPGVRTTAIASLANVGQLDSGVFNVKWYLDSAQVGYGLHRSLAPGQTSNGNVRFDWTPKQGTHRLRFEADVDNHVTELVETNNAAAIIVGTSIR